MRVFTVVAVGFIRLCLVWPVLLLWWLIRFAKNLIEAIFDIAVYMLRWLIGGVMRPLGHRYALMACAGLIVVIAIQNPRAQSPTFYPVLGIALLACFLAGKFGRILLPRSAPDLSGVFPALPGWPTWPPFPQPRPPERQTVSPDEIIPPPAPQEAKPDLPPMPERPAAFAVQIVASPGAMPAPSEQQATAALPEALKRLMTAKSIQSGN